MNQKNSPPSSAKWLVSRLSEYENRYSLEGDMAEVWESKCKSRGRLRANHWYIKETVKSSFSYMKFISGRNCSLILNSFKPVLRNIVKFKGYSLINILGLAIAVTVALMIAFFIRGEMQMDSFQKKGDRIYRLEAGNWALLGAPHGKIVKEKFAEVEEYVTFNNISYTGMYVKKKDNTNVSLKRTMMATEAFFRIFNVDFIHAVPEDALKAPFTIVLNRSEAMKIFGTVDVVGRNLVVNKVYTFKVVGVMEDMKNVHFRVGSVMSFITLSKIIDDKRFMTRLGSWNHGTFLLLKPGVNLRNLEKKITAHFSDLYFSRHNEKSDAVFSLRNYRNIYFCKEKFHEYSMKRGSSGFLMILGGIAVFIILIACMNYINISTAIAGLRAKEIGLRKTVGGSRGNLIMQFMMETAVICSTGFVIASGLLWSIMPGFSKFLNSEMSFTLFNPWVIGIMGGVWLTVTIMAGLYPALYLTSFKPAEVLKGRSSNRQKGSLRKILVVFQFAVSVGLSIATLIIFDQINYMRNAETGFTKDQVINFALRGDLRKKKDMIKEELLKMPDIKGVAYSNTIPGRIRWTETFKAEGRFCSASFNPVDEDYLKVMDLNLLEGRNLIKSDCSSESEGFLCNETAVKALGLKKPWAGKRVDNGYAKNARIVGVVKDFHIDSLHTKIKPLFMSIRNHGLSCANVRVSGKNVPEVLSHIEKLWKRYAPDYPFRYVFLNESFDSQYRKEEKMGNMVGYFALIALFIAGAGLTGLSSFTARQKRKEVSLRKVLGASVPKVVLLLSADFMKWVLLANIIAWPLAWSGMNTWLSNFAYRTDIDITLFILSGSVAFITAFITICFHSVKAATENPAEVLRCDI